MATILASHHVFIVLAWIGAAFSLSLVVCSVYIILRKLSAQISRMRGNRPVGRDALHSFN